MLIAVAMTTAGCLLLYLSHPNQSWRAAPLAVRPWRWLASGLLLLGLISGWLLIQPVAAVFFWMMLIMLWLGLLPLCALLPGSAGYRAGQQRWEKQRR
jgi:cell division protein FtsW (lipid II flippase)